MIFLFEFASFTIGCFVRIHGSSQHLLTSLLIASAQICSACNFLSPPLSLPFTPSLPPSPSLSLSFSLNAAAHGSNTTISTRGTGQEHGGPSAAPQSLGGASSCRRRLPVCGCKSRAGGTLTERSLSIPASEEYAVRGPRAGACVRRAAPSRGVGGGPMGVVYCT